VSDGDKGLFQRVLDKAVGLFGGSKAKAQPSPVVRQGAYGPRSHKQIFTLEKKPSKWDPADKAKFERDFPMVGIRTPEESAKARKKQFDRVFPGASRDLPEGIQRAILPNTFGSKPYQSPAGGPGGFRDVPTDPGGNPLPGAAPQTYASPATHIGPTEFGTAEEDDLQFQNFLYDRARGLIPEGMSWKQYAQKVKSER